MNQTFTTHIYFGLSGLSEVSPCRRHPTHHYTLGAAAGTYKVIALTNNFAKTDVPPSELAFLGWDEGGPTPPRLRELFDDFCDSSALGMR